MVFSKENVVIGFAGIGVMGASMAGHLLRAGYRLNVFNRTKSKAEGLVSSGAVWKDTIAELASDSNVIITMLGYPRDVEEVYLGKAGLINYAKPGTILIDMTTSSPALAIRIHEAAKAREAAVLDAPVSGGDVGAKEARLTIMVGGEPHVFETAKPILGVMGKNIILQGEAGAGQYTKLCNQIAIAPGMLGVCEALLFAKKSGLEPAKVLESIENGAAGSWSLSNYAPRILRGDFAPGFYVKHFVKDMAIALESAKQMKLELPGLELAKALYDRLVAMGEENCGTHALYKLYEG